MCTSVFQIGQLDGTHILSRTMDWPRLGAKPIFIPRAIQWRSIYDDQPHMAKYAVLGTGSSGARRFDVSDGVNERGLVVQKLTFANGTQLVDQPHVNKVSLAPFELSYYLLATYESVQDIIEHIDEIELMTDTYSRLKYGKAELHFTAMDRTGRIVAIEPDADPISVVENPLGVLTNVNHFDKQINQLSKYVEFTPEFINHTVPLNSPRVTTGRSSGKLTPPGSYTPSSRFIRAAYLKERINLPQNEDEAVNNCWHILDSVNVPKSTDFRPTYSVYRAAACSESLNYYFQSYYSKAIVKIHMDEKLLSSRLIKIFDVNDVISFQELN